MTDKLTCGRLSTCELCSRCLLHQPLRRTVVCVHICYIPHVAWSSSRWTGFCQNTFSRVKSPPYALTPSETALPTALTQGLPRCTLKPPAQAHWPHWQRSRRSSGMLRTAVDDGVVDFGLFSCIACLAAWQDPIEPGVQQPPAALWRGPSLARAQLQHPEHA